MFFSWFKQYKRGGNFTEACKGYSRCDLEYCAKVMQAIIVEYRENRDISAIFNAN